MSDSNLPSRSDAPAGGAGGSFGVQDLITRAQRLIDSPRPVGGYPLAWYVEASHVGDLVVVAATALREAGSSSAPPAR